MICKTRECASQAPLHDVQILCSPHDGSTNTKCRTSQSPQTHRLDPNALRRQAWTLKDLTGTIQPVLKSLRAQGLVGSLGAMEIWSNNGDRHGQNKMYLYFGGYCWLEFVRMHPQIMFMHTYKSICVPSDYIQYVAICMVCLATWVNAVRRALLFLPALCCPGVMNSSHNSPAKCQGTVLSPVSV